MRRPDIGPGLSARERADLAALDRALAGEPLDGELAGIERLVVALEDDAPRLSPAAGELLRRRLDGALAGRRGLRGRHGAYDAAAARRPRSGSRLAWVSRPAIAAAVTVLVVVVAGTWVAIDQTSGPSQTQSSVSRKVSSPALVNGLATTTSTTASAATTSSETTSAAGAAQGGAVQGGAAQLAPAYTNDVAPSAGAAATAGGSAAAAGAGAPAPLAPPQSFSGATAGTPGRQVQHDVGLTLSVAPGHVQAAANGVVQVAERYHGYVASSYVSTGSGVAAQADFTLRLPADRLSQELAALTQLGNVTSLNQNTLDITNQVNGASDALAQDTATRKSLLLQLAAATTEQEIDTLKSQLRAVSRRIAGDQSNVADLHHRATFATLQVAVFAAAPVHHKHKQVAAPWTIRKALHHALSLLEHTVAAILIVLAVAAPILILIGLAWWGAALARRRRREQALRTA